MSKMQKEIKSIESQIRKKFGNDLISIIQIGSSLRPKEMFPNSDIDFVVILKKKPKDWFASVNSSYETNILTCTETSFPACRKSKRFSRILEISIQKFDKKRKSCASYGCKIRENIVWQRFSEI